MIGNLYVEANAAGVRQHLRSSIMNQIIYLVGLVVVVLAILSFVGLR